MMNHNSLTTEERIKKLIRKQNEYVGFELNNFITIQLAALNKACKLIELAPEKVIAVHNAFIKQLEVFNFEHAYRAQFKRKDKYSTNLGLDIDRDSFNQVMLEAIPTLAIPDEFISQALGIKAKKEHIKSEVVKIHKVINEYSGDNKEQMIDAFNMKIATLIRDFDKKGFFAATAESKAEIKTILDEIQTNENQYYSGLTFFSQARQSNSTLQPKIEEAKKILANIKIGDESASPSVEKTERRFYI